MDELKKKDRYEDAKKFVRYSDGAKMYSMGMTKFQEVAKDAKACYKIGHVVNDNYINISVDTDTAFETDGDTNDAIITVEYSDAPAVGELTVEKKGEVLDGFKGGLFANSEDKEFVYKEGSLAGAVFKVYAAEDIFTADKQKDADGNRTKYYSKGDLVATLTTGKDGKAVAKNLPLGQYKVVEVTAPDGYVLNPNEQTVTFTYVDDKTPVIKESLTFSNDRQKLDMSVTKLDSEDNTPIAGAVFGLYADEDIKNVDGNRTATETYLLRETNLPTGYVDTGDIQITVEIANGAFKITDAKLVDREANENQEAVKAPVDGKIDGKSVLLQRGDTSLNIRNFAKTGTLHIKKTWENPNDALTEKQVKIRLYQNGISTGQEFLLNEENGWEHTVDNVPLFQDRNPVEYKVEEIEIGKTHYSLEYGDGFLYYEVIYPEIQYFDSNGQQIFPKDENEFKDVSKMELEVQNLHFNLAERSFLKTDDLPRNRLAGAGFLFYKVPYDDVTKKYADDTGYTVDYDNTQSKDDIVLKKDGKTCTTYRSLETDENGMLQLPEDFENGRYWMVESVTPNKKDKADKTKTQYQDNFNLYMVDVESDILFLYEKSPMTNTWRAVSDRHIVNHPQKGGVTVEITKEVTGPLGNRKKPFDMEILYWEDGQKLRSKTIRTSLKHGDKVTLKNVDISSDIIITETVDTSKYAVSISKKEENDKYSNPVQATSNGNTAVMKQRIEAARGDVIELKITNENTQLIPETGVRLRTSRHVWLLFAISIIMILFFRRRRKIR